VTTAHVPRILVDEATAVESEHMARHAMTGAILLVALGAALEAGAMADDSARDAPGSQAQLAPGAHVDGAIACRLEDPAPRLRWRPSFLPQSFAFPDLYAVDIGDRVARGYAAPITRTGYGSLNLLPERLSVGRALSLRYETEKVPALRDSSSLILLEFQLRF